LSKHVFEQEQFLPIPIEEAWDFFSDPRNLGRITPPQLDFKIISAPEKCVEGSIIEYRIKPLLGISVKWVSLIKDIKAPNKFVDIQEKGPYRYWHHHHYFEEVSGGVLIKDIVHYELPFEWIFPWLNNAVIVKQLNKIFNFRYQSLKVLFGNGDKSP
jgi:ligand-binding SRPBCC domain-containing protein